MALDVCVCVCAFVRVCVLCVCMCVSFVQKQDRGEEHRGKDSLLVRADLAPPHVWVPGHVVDELVPVVGPAVDRHHDPDVGLLVLAGLRRTIGSAGM